MVKNAETLGPGAILIVRSEGECGSEIHAFLHWTVFMKHVPQLGYCSRPCRYSSEQKRKGPVLVEKENTHKNEQIPWRKIRQGVWEMGAMGKVLVCVEGGQRSSHPKVRDPKERTSGHVGVWEKGALCRGSLR